MGFSYRKSFKLAPGIRVTASKSGIGYSVGGKGVRVTKRARGGFQTTVHVPGTGLSYTSTSSSAGTRKRSKPQSAEAPPKKTRRRERATAQTPPADVAPLAPAAPALARDNTRRSWRRKRHIGAGSEVEAMTQGQMPAASGGPRSEREVSPPSSAPADATNQVPARMGAEQPRQSFRGAGLWYFVVTILTVGTFAWVPFLHAARRLKTPKARALALAYGAVDVLMYVLMAFTPKDSQGQAVNSPVSTIGGLLMLAVVIVGCIQLSSLRRMVYLGAPVDEQTDAAPVDPAVQAVLAARSRREEARSLAAKDPLLARELHIGRPDFARDYDDGGLVDVNSAPAQVIAGVCGIPIEAAATIVAARERQGGQFSNIEEVFVMAELPVPMWDRVRDRAIALA